MRPGAARGGDRLDPLARGLTFSQDRAWQRRARTPGPGGQTIDRSRPRALTHALLLAAGLALLLALARLIGASRPPAIGLPLEPATVEPRPAVARLLLLRPPVPRRAAPLEPAAAPPDPRPEEAEGLARASLLRRPAALSASLPEEGEAWLPLDHIPLAPPLTPLRVASPFGPRPSPFTGLPSRHEGVDLSAPPGTPVRAAAAGRVRFAGRDGPFGLAVELDHGNGLTTRYAHLSRILVRPGTRVAAGRPIGLVGSTGRSTGPHLHYEVRLAGRALDPLPLLEAGRLLALARAGLLDPSLDGGPGEVYGPIGLGGEVEPPT